MLFCDIYPFTKTPKPCYTKILVEAFSILTDDCFAYLFLCYIIGFVSLTTIVWS